MRAQTVYIAVADGEEPLAEQLAGPIRSAGYEVAHNGLLTVGESTIAAATRILEDGSPIVLCATVRSVGSAWTHQVINAAYKDGAIRVFVVQMERQAYVKQLAPGVKIARYCDDPENAIRELRAALEEHYPLGVDGNLLIPLMPAEASDFLDNITNAISDADAVAEFRASLREEILERIPSDWPATEFLDRAGLMVSGRLTRAGGLLFALTATLVNPSAVVKCVKYAGVDRASPRKDVATFDGPLFRQIFEARKFVADNSFIGEFPSHSQAQAADQFEYPMIAVREIIANALVHRDYTDTKSCVHVRLFSDHLEIASPGTWLGQSFANDPLKDLSELIGQSIKRNFRLANVLSWIKLVEGEGSGIPSALHDCRAMGVADPKVAEEQGFTIVTFPGRGRPGGLPKLNEASTQALREMVPRKPAVPFADLLPRLRVEAGLTQEGLAMAAGLSTRSVSDLERGINERARPDTARMLADALGLAGQERAEFLAASRGTPVAPPAGRLRTGAPVMAGSVAAATSALPRDVTSFTGRRAELGLLTEAISGGVVGIWAIGGMAGIGKTAFAVHAAHLLAPQFPDGQIYLPLHGHTPGQNPVDPAEALSSLLLTAGVPANQIPPGLETRSRLWRDHLAGMRLLLVLDDAAGHEQVRPLLPGTAGSLVLVTSRRHLTALEDTHTINLDTLPAVEAAELLIRLAGRPGLDAGDGAVGELTRLCGYLPLAIGMLARQLAHHPAWSCGSLAADLAAARDRLAFMHAENLSVAAAFGLSYDELTPGQQQMFRRLGLHPGNDIEAYAAAALAGVPLAQARQHLEALYDQHLLTEPGYGRYRMHDLILEHARSLAADDPAGESDLALGRLLDYYLDAALSAGRKLPQKKSPGRTRTATVDGPVQAPDLSTRERAIEWVAAERQNLQAAASYALLGSRRGDGSLIVTSMHPYLRGNGHWDQAQSLYQIVIRAARDAGDQVTEADALTDLGEIQQLIGDYRLAVTSVTRALELYRELGDRLGEASALNELGIVQLAINDHPASVRCHEEALALYRELGNRSGEASALNELGLVQRANGDYRESTVSHERALGLYRELGNRVGEASALNRLAQMQRSTGDYPLASANHELALRLHTELGNLIGQATALYGQGIVHEAAGDNERAAASHKEALELYRSLSYRYGEATALNGLGQVQVATGDHHEATVSYERALYLNRELGNRVGQATSLTGLAAAARGNGDYAAAAEHGLTALQLCQDTGHRPGEADALSELGALQLATGDYDAASASLSRALKLYRQLGIRSGEATVLNTTGEVLLATAQPAEALAHYAHALSIANGINLRAEQIRAQNSIQRWNDGTPTQPNERPPGIDN